MVSESFLPVSEKEVKKRLLDLLQNHDNSALLKWYFVWIGLNKFTYGLWH